MPLPVWAKLYLIVWWSSLSWIRTHARGGKLLARCGSKPPVVFLFCDVWYQFPLSFVADSDKQKEEWVEAMQNSIGEALSNYEVAEKIWKEESNCFCADCGAAQPEWAAINLCVVFCKRCAGMCALSNLTVHSIFPGIAWQCIGLAVFWMKMFCFSRRTWYSLFWDCAEDVCCVKALS